MSRPSRWEREAAKATSEVARRAIRRLDVLEWVLVGVMAGIAVGGGWLVAALLVGRSAGGFRTAWTIASLVLFVVPGVIGIAKVKREEDVRAVHTSGLRKDDDG